MKQIKLTKSARSGNAATKARQGFTLMQLLLVMAMVAILSALFIGAFGRSRATARRAQCDVRLKTITMALDAFRQENGNYPENLKELVTKKYITEPAMLHCPSDPRPDGSFNDYYVIRWGRDSGELPILVCPLCANESGSGLQAFKGRYTKQFATRPAEITEVSGATVQRPGKNPISARAGMELRGGDIIRTPAGGSATVRFADGSTSTLSGGTEITLLQSFIAGNSHAPLYTLLRQQAGNASYIVHHGSKFDVSTPTATAGALGTAFEIKEDSAGEWWLKVTDSRVHVSDLKGSDIYTPASAGRAVALSSDGTPVTQTDDWTFIGQSEAVAPAASATPTPPTSTPPAPKKKIKKDRKGKNKDDD